MRKRVLGHAKNALRHEHKVQVSPVGLGTAQFSGIYHEKSEQPLTEDQCESVLRTALLPDDTGYPRMNYLDTSVFYGDTKVESMIGRMLNGIRDECDIEGNNIVDNLMISTKTGRYGSDRNSRFDFGWRSTRDSVLKSMERLGRQRLDVVFAHDIEYAPSLDQVIYETIPCLFEEFDGSQVRCIGLSSMNLDVLLYVTQRLAKRGINVDVWINYNECSPFNSRLPSLFNKVKCPSFIQGGYTNLGSVAGFSLDDCRRPPIRSTFAEWHPMPEKWKRCFESSHLFAMDYYANKVITQGMSDHELVSFVRKQLLRVSFGFCAHFSSDEHKSNKVIDSILVGAACPSEIEDALLWTAPLSDEEWEFVQMLREKCFAPILDDIYVVPGSETNVEYCRNNHGLVLPHLSQTSDQTK